MPHKLSLTLVLIFLSISLKAQTTQQPEEQPIEEPEETSKSIRRYKYDIGVDLQWLFAKTIINYHPGYGESYSFRGDNLKLFGRINKSKQLQGKYRTRRYAYRFGLGLSGDYSLGHDVQPSSSTLQYMVGNGGYYIAPEIGYEIQKQFQKFQLFYGLSLGLSYSNYSYETYTRNDFSSQFIKHENKSKTSNVSLSPLIGMKFFIHSRVSVSTESRLNIGYYSEDFFNGQPDYRSRRKGISYSANALHAFNINYHFN